VDRVIEHLELQALSRGCSIRACRHRAPRGRARGPGGLGSSGYAGAVRQVGDSRGHRGHRVVLAITLGWPGLAIGALGILTVLGAYRLWIQPWQHRWGAIDQEVQS
jgi:hypothetical protein